MTTSSRYEPESSEDDRQRPKGKLKLTALKYPFYFVIIVFILLTAYSVSTEKPRQYRAKAVEEVPMTKPLTDRWSENEKAPSPSNPNSDKTANPPKSAAALKDSSPAPSSLSSPSSVVAAFSNNDAGGKIVLTLTKCEKAPGLVAYTTAQDGKIDFGCWTFDELYILVHWDKAGLNNYTYDRFFDIANDHLKSKSLFELTKDINLKGPPIQTTHTTSTAPSVVPNTAGGKK